jgi:hypothetical protein
MECGKRYSQQRQRGNQQSRMAAALFNIEKVVGTGRLRLIVQT